MTNKYKVTIAAIAAVSLIEIVAIINGHNGTMRMITIAIICGAAGLVYPTPEILKQKK